MTNLFGKFKIYPRGFLGAPLEPVLQQRPSKNPDVRLQYDVSIFDASSSKLVVANTAIDELYAAMIRRDASVRDMDFREKILSEVLVAFGTRNFVEWYRAQYSSPSFGSNHRDFLDDCIRFLRTGRRNLSINSSDALVGTNDKRDFDNVLTPTAESFFGRQTVEQLATLPVSQSWDVVNIVEMWCRQPGGISDMLYSAHILFGVK